MEFGRTKTRRSFQPSLADDRLESRQLLSRGGIPLPQSTHVELQNAPKVRFGIPLPQSTVSGYTVDQGRGVIIIMPTGETFKVKVTDSPFLSNGGPTIRFRPYHGKVDLFVYGSTANTTLEIDPQPHPPNLLLEKHSKSQYYMRTHTFPLGTIKDTGILPVHNIFVKTGQIGAIYGFRTADLYGSIVSADSTPIQRIALADIQPGGSISVGGDINTLDVFNNATFSNGGSLAVGRDLNWFNVGNNVTIAAGSAIGVTRDIGLGMSPANGSDPGGQGGFIGGNLAIAPGGQFIVGRSLDAPFNVEGATTGSSGIVFLAGPNHGQNNFNSRGGFTP